jgi:hypothetical protein
MVATPETVSENPDSAELLNIQYVHERIVDRDNENLPGIFQLRGVDVAGNMALRTGGREGRRHTCGSC